MISNFKIAITRQKKLILLFLLTILMPSVVLSIFGIIAIRNEKFRLAQQFENEHRRVAEHLKTLVSSSIRDVETVMVNLVHSYTFLDKDDDAMIELFINRLGQKKLVDQIILLYKEKDPIFPLFPVRLNGASEMLTSSLNKAQQRELKEAEEFEYIHENYPNAIARYNELFINLKDKNEQAGMLNHIARNLVKQKKYNQALKIYSRIVKDYSDGRTSSNLPSLLIAQLQIVDCHQQLKEYETALEIAINVYKMTLENSYNLNEDQLFSYADIVREKISFLLSEYTLSDSLKKDLEELTSIYQFRLKQRKAVKVLRDECIPELQKKFIYSEPDTRSLMHYSKNIDQKNYLISAMMISDPMKKNGRGLLGILYKNSYLERELLSSIIKDIDLRKNTKIQITDLSGKILYGNDSQSKEFFKITTFFKDNLPPWRIDIFDIESGAIDILAIHKSFYFWTILTLIIILSFGVILVVKTVAHEIEVLKIKSDFVSSVSHEFKTPLTSIKALTERLIEGKVKDPVKMREYFSVISQDSDRLSRLVGNILNYSKIEEGKKEYNFEETNVTPWLHQTIENFKKENMPRGIKIHTHIATNIPHIQIDKNALAQAINNLLDNAIKFSVEKNEVEVNVKRVGESIVIKIKDHGIGIPQNEIDKIFDKFYQGKNAIKYSQRGTGLGLTLVKHTVEAHGGKISVESTGDRGSTFSLSLPIN